MISRPDSWAVEAASLPLAFAQVREDPRLDVELAEKLPPGSKVVMIASGGDTAVCLGKLPLELHLVDMNPAQLALARVKWELASRGDLREAACVLGHFPVPPEIRKRKLGEIFSRLELDENVFGSMETIARFGPDHCGRYEFTFAELRRHLSPWSEELDRLLNADQPVKLESSPFTQALNEAFSNVMSLDNLVCLFGLQATQNPRRSFSDHFAVRTREAFGRIAPRSNPFLWQILAGQFHSDHPYDWLAAGSSRPLLSKAHWHHGKMSETLDSSSAQSVSLVHLSNILDWLSPAQAQETLAKAFRVLKPGGKVIIRQLNSTLDIPALDAGFTWDHKLGMEMEARDRSYFYPGIHIGSRA